MMTRRLLVLAFGILLSACHDIEHPQSPITPTPRSTAPTRLVLTMSPGELPIGGGSAIVRVEVLGADGLGVSTPVTLTASVGELGAERVTTDSTGHATAAWSGAATTAITGSAGSLTTVANLTVAVAPVFPPPTPTPPVPVPQPPPTPTPTPTPGPTASVNVQPTTLSVPRNVDATFVAEVRGPFEPGETVVAYEWDFDTSTESVDSMTLNPAASRGYSAIGTYTVQVTARTSTGRTLVGKTQIIVTN